MAEETPNTKEMAPPSGTTNCCLPEGWWNQGRELSLSLMGFGILMATTSNTCVGIFPC